MPRNARIPLLLSALLLTSLSLTAAEAPAAGTCTTNEQCGGTDFCSKLFDSCEQSGKCEQRPQDCSEHGNIHIKIVCGCDGKTYDNFCLAAIAGVNIKSEGKCAEPEPSPAH
jgi:hypothetical protein